MGGAHRNGRCGGPNGALFLAVNRPIAIWIILSGLGLAVALGFMAGSGWRLPIAGVAAILVCTVVAYRWPVFAAMAVLLVSGGYSIFAMTPGWSMKGTTVGAGVRVEDVFMMGMLVAALIRAASPAGRGRLGKLRTPCLLLAAWLAFETLRNLSTVGLSAPGELRFFYLLLSVGFCLVASLDREAQVRCAIQGFVLIAVALPLVLLPLVLALKGWSFGPSARVLPSQVSLGLLLGVAVLWVGQNLVRWPRWAVYLTTLLAASVILLDAERIVWLSAVVVLGILTARQPFEGKVRWVFSGLLLAFALIVVAQGLGYDAVDVVAQRGGAVIAQEDTTGIRVSMWKSAWPLIERSPILGRGLGMYWNLYLPEYGYTVYDFPHSLYVMVVANLGVVGMLLFAWLWVRAWRICSSVLRSARSSAGPGSPGATYAAVGLATLGVVAAYGLAYGLEIYSTTLVGICLAGAMLSPLRGLRDESGDA